MAEMTIAVLDREEGYIERLSAYMLSRRECGIRFLCYSDISLLRKEEEKIDYLLATEDFYQEAANSDMAKKLLLLGEGMTDRKFSGVSNIYKFQSADSLMRQIFRLGAEEKEDKDWSVLQGTEMIGIYSPIRHELQVPFAVTLAQLLSGEKKVLYIDLLECSPFADLYQVQGEGDFSDLVYLIGQEGGNFLLKLKSITGTLGNLDYILPVENPSNLYQISEEEYGYIFNSLLTSGYDVIVINFSGLMEGLLKLFTVSSTVYCIQKEGYLYDVQVDKALSYLTRSGFTQQDKIQKIIFQPSTIRISEGEGLEEKLLFGETGDFIRRYLFGEGRNDYG